MRPTLRTKNVPTSFKKKVGLIKTSKANNFRSNTIIIIYKIAYPIKTSDIFKTIIIRS